MKRDPTRTLMCVYVFLVVFFCEYLFAAFAARIKFIYVLFLNISLIYGCSCIVGVGVL